jgi:hypothetical protein
MLLTVTLRTQPSDPIGLRIICVMPVEKWRNHELFAGLAFRGLQYGSRLDGSLQKLTGVVFVSGGRSAALSPWQHNRAENIQVLGLIEPRFLHEVQAGISPSYAQRIESKLRGEAECLVQ